MSKSTWAEPGSADGGAPLPHRLGRFQNAPRLSRLHSNKDRDPNTTVSLAAVHVSASLTFQYLWAAPHAACPAAAARAIGKVVETTDCVIVWIGPVGDVLQKRVRDMPRESVLFSGMASRRLVSLPKHPQVISEQSRSSPPPREAFGDDWHWCGCTESQLSNGWVGI